MKAITFLRRFKQLTKIFYPDDLPVISSSSIHVFFWKKIASNYVTFSYRHFPFFFFFFSRYWHHSWHNNRLRRLTGLWGKYRLRAVSLFLQVKWEQCTRAGAAKARYARNEGGSLFRLAPSVTRVAICVSRVLLDGLQKKERLLVVKRK